MAKKMETTIIGSIMLYRYYSERIDPFVRSQPKGKIQGPDTQRIQTKRPPT